MGYEVYEGLESMMRSIMGENEYVGSIKGPMTREIRSESPGCTRCLMIHIYGNGCNARTERRYLGRC